MVNTVVIGGIKVYDGIMGEIRDVIQKILKKILKYTYVKKNLRKVNEYDELLSEQIIEDDIPLPKLYNCVKSIKEKAFCHHTKENIRLSLQEENVDISLQDNIEFVLILFCMPNIVDMSKHTYGPEISINGLYELDNQLLDIL